MTDVGDEPMAGPPRHHRWWYWPLRVLSGLLVLLLGVVVWFQVSVWPAAMLIRHTVMSGGGLDGAELIAGYLPDDVAEIIDVVYQEGPDGRLDVIYPDAASEPLPTVVWVHGGGFVAGTKDTLTGYLSVIASHGYTVVNVEYTKAPEATYPTPVEQVNAAIAFIVANAETYRVDPDQLVLAGDSAGAHIAAQTAMAIAQPDYAAAAALPTAVAPEALRGTILCSGAFDPKLTDSGDATMEFFLRTVMWAYSGQRDFADSDAFTWATLPEHATAEFPPSFITAGPGDPLLSHSTAMADKLEAVGVEVDALFFDADTTDSSIGHEYQFDLNTPEARQAMERIAALLREVTQTPLPLEGVSDTW